MMSVRHPLTLPPAGPGEWPSSSDLPSRWILNMQRPTPLSALRAREAAFAELVGLTRRIQTTVTIDLLSGLEVARHAGRESHRAAVTDRDAMPSRRDRK